MAYGDDKRQKMGNQDPYAVAKGLPPIPTSMPTAKGPARPGSLPPLSPQKAQPQAQALPKAQPQSMPQGQAQQPMGTPTAYASYAQPVQQQQVQQQMQAAPQTMQQPAAPSPGMMSAAQQAQAQQAAQAAMSMGLGPMQAMGSEYELPMGTLPEQGTQVTPLTSMGYDQSQSPVDMGSPIPSEGGPFKFMSDSEYLPSDGGDIPDWEAVRRDNFKHDYGSTPAGFESMMAAAEAAQGLPAQSAAQASRKMMDFDDVQSGEYPSDFDGDGTISESEFQQWMTQKSTQGGDLITDEMLADQMASLEKGYGVAGAKARQQASRQMGARGFGASGMAAGAIAQVDAQLEADLSNAKTQLWMDQKKANWAQQSQLLQNAMQMAVQDKNIAAQKAISDQMFELERQQAITEMLVSVPEKMLGYLGVDSMKPEDAAKMMGAIFKCAQSDDPHSCVIGVLSEVGKDGKYGTYGESEGFDYKSQYGEDVGSDEVFMTGGEGKGQAYYSEKYGKWVYLQPEPGFPGGHLQEVPESEVTEEMKKSLEPTTGPYKEDDEEEEDKDKDKED